MKVSKAIEKLQEAQSKFGDLSIFFIVKSRGSASGDIQEIEKGTLGDLIIWL